MIAYQGSPYGAYDAYVHQQQLQTAVMDASREVAELGYSHLRQQQQQGHHGLASSAGMLPPPHPFAGRSSGRSSGYSPTNVIYASNGSAYPAQPGYYAAAPAQVHYQATHLPLHVAHAAQQNHDTLRNAGFAYIPAPGQYPSATFGQSLGQPHFVSATQRVEEYPSFHNRNSHLPMTHEARRYGEGLALPPPHASLQPAFEQANNLGWQATAASHTSHFDQQYQQALHQERLASNVYGSEVGEHWSGFGGELTYGDTHHGQVEASGNPDDYGYGHSTFIEPPAEHSGFTKPSRKESRSNKKEEAVIAAPVEEPQLIAPDASSIPPPPPIAKSAHPLAALATDLVWEAFLAAANNNSPASSSPSQFASVDRSGRGRIDEGSPVSRQGHRTSASPSVTSYQRTPSKTISPYVKKHDRSRSASAGLDGEIHAPHTFGAIGGERKPRVSLESSPGSDASSPASSAPGTPAMDTWMISAHDSGHGVSRLGGSGYWSDEDNVGLNQSTGKHNLLPLSSLLRPSALQQQHRFGGVTPPLALFDQIQKLLAATLLSQQVLLLALYYVSRIPYTSPLYPPATSQSALLSTSAPFKLLLAALVVANKHLDDNSFRNSTFAQVANITVPEVNALEYSLLGDLNFDINVETPVWMAWLRELQRHQATRFTRDQVSSVLIVLEVIKGVQIQSEELELCEVERRHAVSLGPETLLNFSRRTRNEAFADFNPSTPRSESSMSGGFDLDASGPIEQRPRYSKHSYVQPVNGHYGMEVSGQHYGEVEDEVMPGYREIGYSGGFDLHGRMAMA